MVTLADARCGNPRSLSLARGSLGASSAAPLRVLCSWPTRSSLAVARCGRSAPAPPRRALPRSWPSAPRPPAPEDGREPSALPTLRSVALGGWRPPSRKKSPPPCGAPAPRPVGGRGVVGRLSALAPRGAGGLPPPWAPRNKGARLGAVRARKVCSCRVPLSPTAPAPPAVGPRVYG